MCKFTVHVYWSTQEAEKERQEKIASVFGGAKPVDTAAREREIEEKLARKNEVIERKLLEDRSPERSGNRQYEHRNRTAEDGERSRDRREGSYDRRDDYDNRCTFSMYIAVYTCTLHAHVFVLDTCICNMYMCFLHVEALVVVADTIVVRKKGGVAQRGGGTMVRANTTFTPSCCQ